MTGRPDPTPYLFVYGTLKRTFDNSFSKELQHSSIYIADGTFPGHLYLVSWFPGAIYDPESAFSVQGEIYKMEDPGQLLPVLDEYEEIHPDPELNLYIRKTIPIISTDEQIFNCWTYLYNQSSEGLRQIVSGIFSGTE